MIPSAFKALGDLLSPDLRSILFKAMGLTLLLFIAVLVGAEVLLSALTLVPWPWVETMIAVGAGLGLLAAFFFLMAPVTAIFAGLYLDDVAARVEARHYAADPPGTPLTTFKAMGTAVGFALVVLAVNLAILPLVFTGIGAAALVAANAYLISREYFEMAAARHMEPAAAKELRRANTASVFIAGLIPALMSVVPLLNIAVPLFATSYFVHIFKRVKASSA